MNNTFMVTVHDVFDIKMVGVVVAGEWNRKGDISAGSILFDTNKKEYKVKSIALSPDLNQAKIGLSINCSLEEAQSLIGQLLIKQK